MKIAVIGSGYVGLVTGVCLADKGFPVTCVDTNAEIVAKINAGTPPIFESGLDELLKRVRANSRLKATTSLDDALTGAEIVFIAVGTPFNGSEIDLTHVKEVCRQMGSWLSSVSSYPVIIVKSSVVPSTTETMVLPELERASGKRGGTDFGVCANPEFLREGSAVADFMNPDRIVIGALDARSLDKVKRIYAWANAPIVETNPRTAEMIKFTGNSLLALLITFANEIANLSRTVGNIDIKEVTRGLHLDFRLNPVVNGKRVNPNILTYIESGCGFGGSCFPKDVRSLASFARANGRTLKLLEQVVEVNARQPHEVLDLLAEVVPDVAGRKIALLGLAFKPGTNDIRESPSIPVARELLRRGAEVIAFDPIVKEEFNRLEGCAGLKHAQDWKSAVSGASACIVMTIWDDFREMTAEQLRQLMAFPFLVDARRFFKKEDFASIRYAGIGYRPLPD